MRNTKKMSIIISLLFLLQILIMPSTISATDAVSDMPQEINFSYEYGHDYNATCYYTDDYFKNDSYTYSKKLQELQLNTYTSDYLTDTAVSLTTASLCVAMSAFSSSEGGRENYADKYKNYYNLMLGLGFTGESICVNDNFKKKPEMDTIGVAAAGKEIQVQGEKYTLISLAVRGGNYETEWSSNFTLGKNEYHEGFTNARNQVMDFLTEYIEDNNISGRVKIWITGYSRGGAVANLVGGAIDDGLYSFDGVSISLDDVYTFCFEAPGTTLTTIENNNNKYNNIINIINPCDAVPVSTPLSWNFTRYGIDLYTPSKDTVNNYDTYLENMLKIYNSLEKPDEYVLENFIMKTVNTKGILNNNFIVDNEETYSSQELFVRSFFDNFANFLVCSRDLYADYFQDGFRELARILFEKNPVSKTMEIFITYIKKEMSAIVMDVIISKNKDAVSIIDILMKWLDLAIKETGNEKYDRDLLLNTMSALFTNSAVYLSTYSNELVTFFGNADKIGLAHSHELCYAWLASMDRNYNKNAKPLFTNGALRVVKLSGDISYTSGCNRSENNYIIIPACDDNEIIITADSDCTLECSIEEYIPSASTPVREIVFRKAELTTGDTCLLKLPKSNTTELIFPSGNGSDTEYILSVQDNHIKYFSDSSLTVKKKSFYVKASPNDIQLGDVGDTISKSIEEGSLVTLKAIKNNPDNIIFDGWYDGALLISRAETISFYLTSDLDLTANFSIKDNSPAHTKKTPAGFIILIPVGAISCIILITLIILKNKKKTGQ